MRQNCGQQEHSSVRSTMLDSFLEYLDTVNLADCCYLLIFWTTSKRAFSIWYVCFLRHQHSPDFVMLTRMDNHIFELCLQNACVSNVHMTCPLPPTQRKHKGWRSAPDAILPGHRWHPSGFRQGHPLYTGALTAWGGRGWPDTDATNGEVTMQ